MRGRTRLLLADLRYLRTVFGRVERVDEAGTCVRLCARPRPAASQQPVPLPELVVRCRGCWPRMWPHGGGRSTMVGAVWSSVSDEVDKILDGEWAEAFLDDIKAVFGVPGCLYLVSLGEDALAVLRPPCAIRPGPRDSAFDEVVAVTPNELSE